MRPGRRVNQERMAQEHIAGLSRREHRRAVRAGAGRALAGQRRLEPVVTSGCEDRRDVKMRAGTDPGRRAIGFCVREQVQREQPPRPGAEVDPPLPGLFVAGLDMPACIAWIHGTGKPDRNRAPDALAAPPAVRSDELIARLRDDLGGSRFSERAAFRAGDPDHRSTPARPHHRGRDRTAQGQVAAGEESVNVVPAQHGRHGFMAGGSPAIRFHGARLAESPTQDVARSTKTIYLESR